MKRATENRQATPVISRSAASLRPSLRAGRAPAALAGGILIAIALTACTGGSPSLTQPDVATPAGSAAPKDLATSGTPGSDTSQTATAAQPGPATPSEDPATAVMKQTVTDALTRLAAGTPKPTTAQVTEALAGAGVAAAALEVSASRTPTGLEADAIEAAVLQGTDCVVGHIRDGSVSVTILPVLATGKCFVGAGA